MVVVVCIVIVGLGLNVAGGKVLGGILGAEVLGRKGVFTAGRGV